jgi:hypothetical protein
MYFESFLVDHHRVEGGKPSIPIVPRMSELREI